MPGILYVPFILLKHARTSKGCTKLFPLLFALVFQSTMNYQWFFLVAPTGLEPVSSALRGQRPNQLDDGAESIQIKLTILLKQ
jgi:hypothetical protein